MDTLIQSQPLTALSLSEGILLVNILLVFILVGFGILVFHNLLVSQAEASRRKKAAFEKAFQIQEEAAAQAALTVEAAAKKAAEIIAAAEEISMSTRKTLEGELSTLAHKHAEHLEQASLKYINEYQQMGQAAQKEYQQTLHDASQTMAAEAAKTLQLFEKFLKAQTVGYETATREKVEQLRKDADAYVEEYRRQRMKKVDSAIHRIILLVSRDIIGQGLELKEHNQLVIQALDRAKREGFFEP